MQPSAASVIALNRRYLKKERIKLISNIRDFDNA